MTLKVIGSGEIVEQVFWLDIRTRTCGVMLRNTETGDERCSERPVADFLLESKHAGTRANVEIILGNRAQVILGDE